MTKYVMCFAAPIYWLCAATAASAQSIQEDTGFFVTEIAVRSEYYFFKLADDKVPLECNAGVFFIGKSSEVRDSLLSLLLTAKAGGIPIHRVEYQLDSGNECNVTQINVG